MTAPVTDNNTSAPPVVKSIGSFVIDPNFGQNQKIKVSVRMRPPLEDPEKAKSKKAKNVDKPTWTLSKTGAMDTLTQKGHARKKEGQNVFHFDQIFDENTQTPLLYKSIARPMVQSVLNGKNATIFAYGQTGSGKTYTMQGEGKKQSGQAGIIQLVASDLFRFMRMGEKSKRDFIVKVAYVEVYNERIRDLLSDDVGSTASHGASESNGGDGPQEVSIQATANGEVVLNCVKEEVSNVDEVLELLVQGNTHRVVAKTDMNTHSSRSHAVFRLSVESREKGDPSGPTNEVLRVSDFNLVDLAGSESLKVSNTNGLRLREGAKINQSLLSLSTVIHSLGLPEKKRPKHINYRDSKLTRILQPQLSGNAEMAIICCASTSKAFVEETRSTLKFGARAKLVQVKPKVNEILDDTALIKKLEHELAEARRQLEDMKSHNQAVGPFEVPEQRPRSHTMSTDDNESADDSLDYGYEDMEAAPTNRQYVMPKDQEVPHGMSNDEESLDGKGRGYVMPKGQHIPKEMERKYVMPKNQEIPEAMEKDYSSTKSKSSRPYVMPKNHEISMESGMGDYLDRLGDDRTQDMHDSAAFKLDSVDPASADKAIYRFMQGKQTPETDSDDTIDLHSKDGSDYGMSALDRLNAKEWPTDQTPDNLDFPVTGHDGPRDLPIPGHYLDKKLDFGTPSRNETTAPTEDESYDGPEMSYGDVSFKFGSMVSSPDTLQAESAAEERSKYGTLESAGDRALDGRGNKISWDTMDLNTLQPDQVGKPLRAMQSIYNRESPLPENITIMCISIPENEQERCITDRLEDAETRAAFLQDKLDVSDDLVESIFKDLERARLCIHDLVYRNVQLAAKLKEKRRDDIKEEYQEGEVVVEQYWLLKGCMYTGLFFFVTGGYEFFMAAVILIWLILEVNLSP